MKRIGFLVFFLILGCTQNKEKTPFFNEKNPDLVLNIDKSTIGTEIQLTNPDLQIDGELNFGQIYNLLSPSVASKKIQIKNNTTGVKNLEIDPLVLPYFVSYNRCKNIEPGKECEIEIKAVARNTTDGILLNDQVLTLRFKEVTKVDIVFNIELISNKQVLGGGKNPLLGDWSVTISMDNADRNHGPVGNNYELYTYYLLGQKIEYRKIIVYNSSSQVVPANTLIPNITGDYLLRTNRCVKPLFPQESCEITLVWTGWRQATEILDSQGIVELVKNQQGDLETVDLYNPENLVCDAGFTLFNNTCVFNQRECLANEVSMVPLALSCQALWNGSGYSFYPTACVTDYHPQSTACVHDVWTYSVDIVEGAHYNITCPYPTNLISFSGTYYVHFNGGINCGFSYGSYLAQGQHANNGLCGDPYPGHVKRAYMTWNCQ